VTQSWSIRGTETHDGHCDRLSSIELGSWDSLHRPYRRMRMQCSLAIGRDLVVVDAPRRSLDVVSHGASSPTVLSLSSLSRVGKQRQQAERSSFLDSLSRRAPRRQAYPVLTQIQQIPDPGRGRSMRINAGNRGSYPSFPAAEGAAEGASLRRTRI
jgi:hypothetical protein